MPRAKSTIVRGSTEMVPIEKIVANANQPRQFFDQNALDELASSLRQHGLLQPLVVRPMDGSYQIIAGERRWRASQLAGLATLECRVLHDLDDEQAFILSVTENVARRDMTIIEEARAYHRIVGLGRTKEEVAGLFGKTPEHVQYRVDLLDLRDDLQHMAGTGQISRNLAWYVSRLSQPGQSEVINKVIAGSFKTDDEATRYAAAVRMREEQPAMFGGEAEDEGDALEGERKRVQKTKLQSAWSKLDGLVVALAVFQEFSPVDLAQALGGDTRLYGDRLALLHKSAGQAKALMSQAVAIHEAMKAEAA